MRHKSAVGTEAGMLQFNCMELILFNCVFQLNQYKNVQLSIFGYLCWWSGLPSDRTAWATSPRSSGFPDWSPGPGWKPSEGAAETCSLKQGIDHHQTWCQLEVNKRHMTPGKENRSSSAIDLLLPFAGIQLNGGSSNLHLLDIFDTCPKEIGLGMCTFAILKVICGCVLDYWELSHISMLCQEEFMEQNISRSNARNGCDCQWMAFSLSLFKLKSYQQEWASRSDLNTVVSDHKVITTLSVWEYIFCFDQISRWLPYTKSSGVQNPKTFTSKILPYNWKFHMFCRKNDEEFDWLILRYPQKIGQVIIEEEALFLVILVPL